MQNKYNLNKLEHQRAELLDAITNIAPMVPGAYKEVYRKCGKQNCWCQSSTVGHPFRRITWKEGSASHTKKIDKDEIEWVMLATENYRKYRYMLVSLIEIEKRIYEALKEYSFQVIDKSRKEKQW